MKMKKVLVVDDADFMRSSLRLILERENYEVLEAEDGYQAVNIYSEEKPDVVTMDINMPGKTGLEAIKEIRELDPEAKIIVVTAMGTEFMIRDAIQNGAANFIIKPFDEKQILEVVKKLV
jgi:two-component system chemotaxis response regulator CheY